MNKILKSIIVTSLVIFATNCVNAIENKPLEIKTETNVADLDMVIKDNFIKSKFSSAENKFIQSNIKASYSDFNDIIQKAKHDDYVLLLYGIKISEYGFFDLSESLIQKLDNNIYTKNYANEIRKFYYPSSIVKEKDYLLLADAYSNIVYNNMAIETTSELINSTRIDDSDYKDFLISLGYYKSNDIQQALKYINQAIQQNDNNVNYMLLKAKILADANKSKQALKLIAKIKKLNFKTVDFQNKILATEEYVLYKISKLDTIKDYHLAYYYHLQGKSLLATKVLQTALIQAKQNSSDIYSLLGKIYYDNNELAKAKEFSMRAYKENHQNDIAILTLANLNYEEMNYKEALKFYKKAKHSEIQSQIGIANSLLGLQKEEKSKKIYEKMLKKHTNNEDLLIDSLQLYPQKADEYLPKIASMDLSNNDIWLNLANLSIRDNNYKMAITHLNNSYYLDTNNFKYYYYLSLVLRAKGDIELANKSLIKCSRLNSDYATEMKSE